MSLKVFDMACKAKKGNRSAAGWLSNRRAMFLGLGGNLFEGVLVGLLLLMAPVAIHADHRVLSHTPTEIYEGETLKITVTISNTIKSTIEEFYDYSELINHSSSSATHQSSIGGSGDWYFASGTGAYYDQKIDGYDLEDSIESVNGVHTVSFYLRAQADANNNEGDENIILELVADTLTELFTITLKDGPRPGADGVTISPTALSLTELGADSAVEKTYTVVLDTEPTADVTVTATIPAANQSDVQIKAGSGSFGNSATMTFTAGGDGSGSGAGNGNWAVPQTVTVRALNDGDAVGESFNLTHAATAASGPYNNITIDPVAVTVADAGHGVVVSESSVSVAENDETVTYTVVLKSQPSGNVVISATSGATATATVSPSTLTFNSSNWNTPKTVTITGKGAGSTTISHAVTSATVDQTNYPTTMTIPGVGVAVIAAPGVSITETSGSTVVNEDGSTTDSYDIVLDAEPTHDVTVTVSAGSGVQVNKAGGNHASSQTLTFTPSGAGIWSTAQTIAVRGVNDNADNAGGGRTVTISHAANSADPGYNINSAGSVDVRVTDDDATTVTLAGTSGNIEEGQTKTFTITLGRGLVDGESLTVPLTFGGTATRGTDYTLAGTQATGVQYNSLNSGNATVVFTGPTSGTTARTATITLSAAADNTAESTPETVDIDLGTITNTGLTGAGGVSRTDSLAEFSITDPGGVTVSPTSLALTELGSPTDAEKTYSLVLDTDPGANVTITVTNGDATAVEVDTDAGSGGNQNTMTFTAGGNGSGSGTGNGNWAVPQTVTVRALNDGDAANESFNLTHAATAASGPYDGITINPVAITTDDAGHGVAVSESSVSVAANDETATYTIVLRSQPTGNVVISATSGNTSNATVSPGTLTFTNGNWDTPQPVTITGKGMGSTSVSHAVSTSADTTNYPTSTTIDTVSVTVTADSRQVLDVAIASTSQNEGTSVNVTLTATGASGNQTVAGGTSLLTFTGDGIASSDYSVATANSFALTGTPPATTVALTLADDAADEPNETLVVGWQNLPAGFRAGTTASITIIDQDPTTVTLAGSGTVREDGSNSTDITVTLSRRLHAGETVTVPLTITGTGITADDYTIVRTPGGGLNTGVTLNTGNPHGTAMPAVVFAGHNTDTVRVATLRVRAQQDRLDEGTSEVLTVGFGSGNRAVVSTLDRATGTGTTGTTTAGSATVTLTDDDRAGLTLTETGSNTVVSEDGSTTTDSYDLVLDSEPTHDVTVTVSAGSGVQVSTDGGTNYAASRTLTFTTANWNTARSITVQGVDDSVDNPGGGRDVTISHATSSTDAGYDIDPAGSVDVRVTDDDSTTVTLAGASGDINEGQTKTFTITLGRGLVDGEVLTVPLTFGGTATRGTDYTLAGMNATGVQYNSLNSGSATVVFTGPQTGATATTATLTLTAATDSTVESTAETVIIGLGTITDTGLTGAGGVDETDGLGDFTISDPPSTANVTVSPASLALTELGSPTDVEKTYSLVLDTDPGADVTITVTNGDATAVAVDTDAGTSGDQNTLTFTHGNTGNWGTARTVTVRALNDGDAAGESFNLTHAATAASGPYDGITINPVAITTTDAGHGVVVSESSVSVDDNDDTATYTITLRSQPTGNVVISATSGNTATAEVDTDSGTGGNQSTLTFTNANWKTPRTVTITGKGAGSTSISHAVQSSADTTNYPTSTTIPSVSVSVTSTATPGVTLTETGGSTVVSEDGSTTDSYDIVLDSRPAHDVTLTVSAGNGVEVSTDGGTSYAASRTLTFTPSGTGIWNTARTITVRGIGDNVDNPGGGRDVTISHATSSTDTRYNINSAGSVDVRVTDDDPTTVTLAGASGNINEGQTKTFTIALGRGLIDGETLTVPLTFVGTATRGTDYTLAGTQATGVQYNNLGSGSATVVFTGPQTGSTATTATITLSATADGTVESTAETVIIGLGTITDTGLTGAGGVDETDGLGDFTISDPPSTANVTVSPASLALTELGSPADAEKTYSLVLDTDPGANVTITVTNGDATAVDVDTDAGSGGNQNTMTFTAGGNGSGSGTGNGNWAVPQTVTVRALNDGDAAGESFNLTHAATAASGPYNGITIAPVAITTTDAGHGVAVSTNGVSVADNDDTATYTITLRSQPTGNVVISATSGATTTATVSPPTLTFTSSNWKTPRTVTITGKGAGTTAITHAVQSSADTTNYPTSTTIPSVSVSVTSTATPGVTLTETGGSTVVSEDGSTTDSYDIVLDSRPAHDVTLTVSAGNGVEVSTDGGTSYAASRTLTFTPSGTGIWNTARTITVRGIGDNVDNPGGGRDVTISHATSSTDPAYSNISVAGVDVRVTDVIVAGVDVSKATVSIREGRSDRYTIVLTSTPQTNVVISITSQDPDIAEAVPKMLTFTPRNARTPQAVTVRGVDDNLENGSPRITVIDHDVLTTNDPDYRGFPIDGITVTVADKAKLEEAALSTSAGLTRFGRTVGQQVVGAVRDREEADRTRGFVSSLAGENLPRIAGPRDASDLPDQEYGLATRHHRSDNDRYRVDGSGQDENEDLTRALSEEDFLRGTSFTLNAMKDDGTSLAFWGRGSVSEFRGTTEGLFLDGEVRDVMVGTDRIKNARLMGIMVMGSRGDITYRSDGDNGRLETSLTSLVPYGSMDLRNGLSFWGAVGVGWGTLTLTPEGNDPVDGTMDWHMAAGGIEGRLADVDMLPGARLGWHTDALWTRTRSEPIDDLPELGGKTTRLRLGVEATWPEKPALNGLVSPHAGLGLRYDGGDAETGFGLEISSGLTWRDPESNLSILVEGRTLAVHEDGDFRDWGLTFGLFWDPRPDTKEGFSAGFGYELGHGTSGENALLGHETYPVQREADGNAGWRSEVAFGVSRGGGMVGSSYGGIAGTSDDVDEARVGYRIEPDTPSAEKLSIDVWTDPVAGDEDTSTGVGLMWRW